ncbi:MAG: hypothetical protein ACKODX_02910 [Gemmata sp.]
MLAALLPAPANADEPAKAQFQTVKLQTLAKTGAQYDWSKTEFIEALKAGDGWEVLATSDSAILLRKGKDGPKWEYKSVKIKNCPLSITGMSDTDAFGVILDRMASDGYMPCAVNGIGEHTLFKRVKDAKPAKTEFQTLLLADVIKAKAAPYERFKEKEFVEALNKQGAEGWEVCVCNYNAVVLQKSPAKWEYKTVKITKSPLTLSLIDMDKDDEAAAFTFILEGLEDKGWRPCACDSMGREILLKRELKKDNK